MRPLVLVIAAAVSAMSACSSPATETATPPAAAPSSAAKAPQKQPAPSTSAPAPANSNANIPGFSGPADPPTNTQAGHIFGRCLHSWFTASNSALRVHVDYPGPADINVDVMISDNSTPPPGTHQDFVMPLGQQVKDLTFPAMPHADYVQVNVMADRKSITCDAAKH